jgi:hypothetical protein
MVRMKENLDTQPPLDRVEIDRLILALDRNATVSEIPAARRVARALRRGDPLGEGTALARRCLQAEGNDAALLRRLTK